MTKHKLVEEEIYRYAGSQGTIDARLLDAIFEVATHAHDHILTAKSMLSKLDRADVARAFPAFLTLIPTISYLKRLESTQFDPISTKRDWKLPFILWNQNRKLSIEF
ncbi:hypothetical protein DSO57_1022342 [Entomophthora muscae]|uniref:Uncharacterized protein n=1 Tax=Entomophthora muscae TaxID=34485 RepID=A0ACC2U1B0_9FUNG|nr:hypothetical protein DSO57_1022342 [Entomophthora muscae]